MPSNTRRTTSQVKAVAANPESTDPVVRAARGAGRMVAAWAWRVLAVMAYTALVLGLGAILGAGAIKGNVAANSKTNDRQDADGVTERAERRATDAVHDAEITALRDDMWVMRLSLSKIEGRLFVPATPGLKPEEPAP